MPTDKEKILEAFQKDSRIACQYGAKCYQKNPQHHTKYKHLPATEKTTVKKTNVTKGTKRKMNSDNGPASRNSESKLKKIDDSTKLADSHRLSPSPSVSSDEDMFAESPVLDSDSPSSDSDAEEQQEEETTKKLQNNPKTLPEKTETSSNKEITSKTSDDSSSSLVKEKKLISELFLVDMPDDFYKFYEFCNSLSKNSPSLALKSMNLELVGPFDVLSGKIKEAPENDKEKFLRHWRYYYDPPEFQTVLKGNDKDGLHYGYWRDEANQKPAFIAKNLANKDCKIKPVGPNIFSAVLVHITEHLKKASLFEKPNISKISQKLKAFAKEHNISLEQTSTEMKSRERSVVAKTFHGAGIVVKYDKKTQLGYRNLAATDSVLQKVLKKIETASTDKERTEEMSPLEEIVRLATIAADECDFGTPLELGHDLFCSGIDSVQKIALQMLTMAYSLLQRPEFSQIVQTHMKNRKKDTKLSVL